MDQHQLQSHLLQSMHESVIATDLNGRITFWNRGAEQMFGYIAAEMLGRSPSFLYPDQDPETMAADLERIREGHDYIGDWRGRRKDGSEVWVHIITTLIRADSGEPIGFLDVSRDITERKRRELEVGDLYSREQQAHGQLREFLEVVAHELRQPLTVISGSLQLLRAQETKRPLESGAPHLRRLEEASGRIRRFLNDMQDAARVGEGQFRLQPTEMDLVDALRMVVDEHQDDSDHHITLDAPRHIQGTWDQDRLVQLFSNLVINAIKYSPSESQIIVRATEYQNEAEIRVIDQGPGIPPDDLDSLFEAFTRLDVNEQGSGLGLYISRGIVEAHGGRIWVESESDTGCQFCVALPMTLPAAQRKDHAGTLNGPKNREPGPAQLAGAESELSAD